MNIKTIGYKRINNLGNYSSEHLEAFAELEPGDDSVQCATELKNQVETALGLNAEPEPESELQPAPSSKGLEIRDTTALW